MQAEDNLNTHGNEEIVQLSCFYVGKALAGIDINQVQEINKELEMTKVPLAQDYVLGIMNLRGKIVTIIDLGKKLGLEPGVWSDKSRIIIINWNDEYVGFFVDRITDVVIAAKKDISLPPSNIKGLKGKYFQGVYHYKKELVAILDTDAVLNEE